MLSTEFEMGFFHPRKAFVAAVGNSGFYDAA